MGIHYDYKSKRGERAMLKEAKRKARLAQKKAKRLIAGGSLQSDSDSEVMYVWDVAKTQPEFKKHAKKWISTYGYAWYFCQCKVNSECQTMLQ